MIIYIDDQYTRVNHCDLGFDLLRTRASIIIYMTNILNVNNCDLNSDLLSRRASSCTFKQFLTLATSPLCKGFVIIRKNH